MKISKLIFLILPLITLTGCPLMGDKKEEPKKETTAGTGGGFLPPRPGGSGLVLGQPLPAPVRTLPAVPLTVPPLVIDNVGPYNALNRAHYLRTLNGSSVKTLIDLWGVRKNLQINSHYYDAAGLPAPAGQRWLRYFTKPQYNWLETHLGYSVNSFWKYYPFINQEIADMLMVFKFQVLPTPEGHAFVHDLRACGGYSDIDIGTVFTTSIFYNELTTHPNYHCLKDVYERNLHIYGGEGGTGDPAELDLFVFANNPFGLREPLANGPNPLVFSHMSPRNSHEVGYINHLKTEISNKLDHLLTTNSTRNPGCTSVDNVAHIVAGMPVQHATCTGFGVTGYALNAYLDTDYETHGGGGHYINFIAQNAHERGLMDAVFNAIIAENETDFINATAKLAASHPIVSQRSIVLNNFPDLFVTKDFPTFGPFSDYMHFLLNCTQFH